MLPFDFRLRTRVVFGNGALGQLGTLAEELRFSRTLLVADHGMVAAGYVARAAALLEAAGIHVSTFHDFDANPDSRMVEAGRVVAAAGHVDSFVALGGGSSLDCAKGINFVLAGGGDMRDYRGFGKAKGALRPSIGIPTTAGTGSEAQSYALISDAETHAKMACGDHGVAFRVAILDPALGVTQPRRVAAVAGIDALSHAVESYVTARRTHASDLFALEAWRLLEGAYERVLSVPDDLDARGAMLAGAHWAGVAIEQSMLGATHACANPLTARYGTMHGVAIAVMLPHVVRWNAGVVEDRYAVLLEHASRRGGNGSSGDRLAAHLAELAHAAGLPATLREIGASREHLTQLAADAATQWTGTFNPRSLDAAAALSLYERAW
ncbi:MAG: iron-containing alcohol dehydrogenase [Vicinamibacterales bacterium]